MLNCLVVNRAHMSRISLNVSKVELRHGFEQILDHIGRGNNKRHQVWFGKVLQVEPEVLELIAKGFLTCRCCNNLANECRQGFGHYLGELLVDEDARSHAIHGEDLYTELDHALVCATMTHEFLHVCDITKA